jgi:hypothetical protein
MNIKPRSDDLLSHPLFFEPFEAVLEVEHDPTDRSQRLASGKSDHVTVVARYRHAGETSPSNFL